MKQAGAFFFQLAGGLTVIATALLLIDYQLGTDLMEPGYNALLEILHLSP